MPPKKGNKKKGGKKGKKGKKDVLPAVSKTFYELTITDLNNRLANLRLRNEELENFKVDAENELKIFRDNREDVNTHLEREFAEKQIKVQELETELRRIINERQAENDINAKNEKEMAKIHEKMKRKFQNQIKELNVRINSLEGFRSQKEQILKKFNSLQMKLQKERSEREETIAKLKAEAENEKQILKEEFKNQLYQLSDNFTSVNQTRITSFVRGIYNENTSLKKYLDDLLLYYKQSQNEYMEKLEKFEKIQTDYFVTKNAKVKLMKSYHYHVKVIERLANQLEDLKSNYYRLQHYKTLYEELLKEIGNKHSVLNFGDKLNSIGQKMELMNVEKQKLIAENKMYANEIEHFQKALQNIKFTIKSEIRQQEKSTADSNDLLIDIKNLEMRNFLENLLDLVTNAIEFHATTPSVSSITIDSSIYKPTLKTLSSVTTSLFDLIQEECDISVISTEEDKSFDDEKQKSKDVQIVPCHKIVVEDNIFDVESGSSILDVSSSASSDEKQESDEIESVYDETSSYSDSIDTVKIETQQTEFDKGSTKSSILMDKKISASNKQFVSIQSVLNLTLSTHKFQSKMNFKQQATSDED